MTESIKNNVDDKLIAGGVFIDLEKGFDTVNQLILCDKLKYYGFGGNINDLMKSFLVNRQQYVSINGYESTNKVKFNM